MSKQIEKLRQVLEVGKVEWGFERLTFSMGVCVR